MKYSYVCLIKILLAKILSHWKDWQRRNYIFKVVFYLTKGYWIIRNSNNINIIMAGKFIWWKRYENRTRVENNLPYPKPAQRMLFKIKEAFREMIDYKQLNKYKQYVTFIWFLMQTSSNWYKSFYSVTFSIIQCFLICLKGMKTVRLWNTALSHDIKYTDFLTYVFS